MTRGHPAAALAVVLGALGAQAQVGVDAGNIACNFACPPGQQCIDGMCVSCAMGTCPGCCDTIGNCWPGNTNAYCGIANQMCVACITGTCVDGGCSTATCANCTSGCCDGSATCVPGTADNACGVGGQLCQDCPFLNNGTCNAGLCSTPTCSAGCNGGCCDQKNMCQPGDQPTACGFGGPCIICSLGQICSGGVCAVPDAGPAPDAGPRGDAGSSDAGSSADGGSASGTLLAALGCSAGPGEGAVLALAALIASWRRRRSR